jgi:hypothetical protein
LNVLLPLVRGIAAIITRLRKLNQQATADWILVTYNISLEGTGIMQVVSGIILVRSVLSIHRFFAAREASGYINTRMLLRHAAAFGFYTATTIAYFSAVGVYIWTPHDQDLYQFVAGVGIALDLGSFVSQLFLVVIFRDLGKKVFVEDA